MPENFFVCSIAQNRCVNPPDQWGMCKNCKKGIPEEKIQKEAIRSGEGVVEWVQDTDQYSVGVTYMERGGKYRIYKVICQGKEYNKEEKI
jgi:hypothetical protein